MEVEKLVDIRTEDKRIWGIGMKKSLLTVFFIILIMICFSGNVKAYTCSTCGNVLQSTGSNTSKNATQHGIKWFCPTHKSNVKWTNLENHTFTWKSNGYNVSHTGKCTKCSYSKTESHSYGAWKKYNDSQHRRTCSKCSSYGTESHTATTAATCTTVAYCGTCKSNFGSALGHDYSVACPTCGTANIVCSRCGAAQAHTCDTTPPTGSIISYPQYTNSSTITIQVNATDTGGSGMSYVAFPTWSDANGQDDINWYTVSGSGPNYSKTIDLKNHTPGTDGIYNIHVYAYDNAGNSRFIGAMAIYYDTTGPGHGYWLDGTPRYTNAADGTTFRVHAQGASDNLSGVSAMYLWVSTDGGASWNKISGQRMNEWDNSGTRAWYYDVTISGEGTYLCHTCPLDKAGNWTWGGPYESVIVDRTVPYVYSITYDPGWKNTSITKDITFIDDLSGIQKIEYSYDNSTWYSDWASSTLSADGKQLTVNRTWSGEQNNVLWFRAIDNAGNIYTYPGAYDLKIDTTPPTANWSDSSMVYTNQSSYTATVNVSDTLSGIYQYAYQYWYENTIIETISSNTNQYTAKFEQGEGNYAIVCWVTDNASNSTLISSNKVFVYDTTPPTISSSDGTKYTASGSVRVNLYNVADNSSGVDRVEWYLYKDGTGLLWQGQPGGNSGTTYYKDLDLSSYGQGWYTVHGIAYDKAGNEYNWSGNLGMRVCYDTTPPTGSIISPNAKNYTNNTEDSIMICIEASDELSGVNRVVINGFYGEVYDSQCNSETATYNSTTGQYELEYTLSEIKDTSTGATNNGQGKYKFDVFAYDNAENSKYIGSIIIICDTFAPTEGSVKINNDAEYTSSQNVTLTLYATDSLSGVAEMAISNTETIGTYEPYVETKSWTLTAGDGLKTVYVVFKDAAGNATVSF